MRRAAAVTLGAAALLGALAVPAHADPIVGVQLGAPTRLSFDTRSTFLLGGDGHAALYAEIVDKEGHVVTTAYALGLPLPINR
ncbi:hypothetical protein [Streptomyces sp. IMTB 2501]|uniref:hypothetical protein n=1 Tax=Streptomyces sp. IMTB 2501 TaxID=1776340 RepID=UPI00117DE272|nr:hypothetical protein [Streptomyces sp. IMTB 2501]